MKLLGIFVGLTFVAWMIGAILSTDTFFETRQRQDPISQQYDCKKQLFAENIPYDERTSTPSKCKQFSPLLIEAWSVGIR